MDFWFQVHRSIPHYHEVVLFIGHLVSWLVIHRP